LPEQEKNENLERAIGEKIDAHGAVHFEKKSFQNTLEKSKSRNRELREQNRAGVND